MIATAIYIRYYGGTNLGPMQPLHSMRMDRDSRTNGALPVTALSESSGRMLSFRSEPQSQRGLEEML